MSGVDVEIYLCSGCEAELAGPGYCGDCNEYVDSLDSKDELKRLWDFDAHTRVSQMNASNDVFVLAALAGLVVCLGYFVWHFSLWITAGVN